MSAAVSRGSHVSIAALLLTLASDASAQQRAPLLHPAPDPRTATSQRMVAPRNSLEALDRHFAQLDRRRLVVRPGPRVVNPQAARLNPNPQLLRALEAHGRTLRAAPAAHPQQQPAVAPHQEGKRIAGSPARETSAVFQGADCRAVKHANPNLNTDHAVLEIRPREAEGSILKPGVPYEAFGCSLGRTTASRAATIPLSLGGIITPIAGAVIHAWSDSRIAFTLIEVANTYDFPITGLSTRPYLRTDSPGQDAYFAALYYAPRVSRTFAAIPQKVVAVSTTPVGSPTVSAPMDFYGLKGAVGVARQSPGGLLPGQDSIEVRLAREVVLESVQMQYLAYDASGATSVSTGPANVSFVQEGNQYERSVAKIRVNWPVSSLVPQGQTQPIAYSVYALSITLKGPKGMPAFDGIPSIVLN
jgi:hypothetical protein